MVSICTVEVDNKGRFILPKKFLESNGWNPCDKFGVEVIVKPIMGQNSDMGVNLIFNTFNREERKDMEGYAEDIESQAVAQGRKVVCL